VPIDPGTTGAGGGSNSGTNPGTNPTLITFNFRPTLNGQASNKRCTTGDDPVCTIVFNVSFATEDYYPGENLSGPEYFLLARDSNDPIDDECKVPPQQDGQRSFTDSNGGIWQYLPLNDETTAWILNGDIEAADNEIRIKVWRERVVLCTYEYLVVEWDNPLTMFIYNLNDQAFHSGLMFTH
jgi:hypothetical protein